MTNEQAFICLMDKCNIYFEDALISKERIVRKYAEFFSASLNKEQHSISIVQHTGSVCFDVISFLIAALGCIALNETENDDVIRSFKDGQIVMLSTGNKKERRLWRGLVRKTGDDEFVTENTDFDNADFACLEQPEQHSKLYLSRQQWYRISPYKGTSTRTDGRGIKRVHSNRNDFISYLFGVPISSVPSVIGVSTVVVTDRDVFKRISEGMRIEYNNGKSIGLLDIVSASYYTSNLEEHQLGTNPAKVEPGLKITSRISAARDLVLDKSGNKTVGFMVVGIDTSSGRNTELSSLLERQSLKFKLLSGSVDSEAAEEVIEEQADASIFVCTKEFLRQHTSLPQEQNPFTVELEAQISNIVNNQVMMEIAKVGCSWQEIKSIKEALLAIKKSNIRSDEKDEFIINAHSLLNLILTAIFPLDKVNDLLSIGDLALRATTPSKKLSDIWVLADKATEMIEQYLVVADTLDMLYRSLLSNCPKRESLLRLLNDRKGDKIAIVVPKAYYAEVIKNDIAIYESGAEVISVNRFDSSARYDAIIVPGDITGTRFNPLRCRSASDIYVLLYDGEARLFGYKKKQADIYERKINDRLLLDTLEYDNDGYDDLLDAYNEDVEAVVGDDTELSQYITSVSAFDLNSFASGLSGVSENIPTSVVYATGKFTSGERVLFTPNYRAVVFNEEKETVIETDVNDLRPGDMLVFVKRDGYTRNMVDYIYEQLQQSGKFTSQLIDASEKAQYWKMVLREYKDNLNLSYRELAKRLQGLGLSHQEVSVRQWLIEESHIVGPRDENTLVQIANLTQNPFLIGNTSAYFEACEIVRRQRKRILKLIGRAIVDKLTGRAHDEDKLLGLVYENVDNLSVTMELEYIGLSDESVSVPSSFTNVPLNDLKVAT